MSPRIEFAGTVATAAVVLTAVLGGAFDPGPRMVVGGALVLVWIVAASEIRMKLDRVELGLLALIAWGAASAVAVGSAPLSAKETLVTWLVAWGLFAVARRSRLPGWWAGPGLLAVGAAVVSVAIIVESAAARSIRVGGLFENPNIAVALLVPALPLGLKVLTGRPRARWLWGALVMLGIALTGSRAGLIGLVVAIALLLPRGRLRISGLVAGSALAVAVLVWRFVSAPDVLAWHRVSIWSAVLRIWWARPVTGVGPGGLVEAAGVERLLHADEIGRYQFVIGSAESTPLAVLVQLGLIGVCLAAVTAFAWLQSMRASSGLSRSSTVACLGAMTCLALFHDLLTIDPVLWWWAVLLGILAGRQPPAGRNRSDGAALRWAVGIGMVWITAWGVASPAFARSVWRAGPPTAERVVRALRIEPWLSAASAGRVRHLLADPEPWSPTTAGEALSWARTSVDIHPGLARLWADLGRVHLRVLTDLGGTEHDVDAARSALSRACELDPFLPWYWLERARLERLEGNFPAALRLANVALLHEPNALRGWLFLGRLHVEAGEADRARQALSEMERRLDLSKRPGLNNYERELLFVSRSQLESLRKGLGATR